MMLTPGTDLDGAVNAYLANFAQDSSGDPIQTVAAATEDGVKVTGESVDTEGYMSAVFVLAGQAVLQDTKLATFTVEYQTSPDNSTWATAVAFLAATALATGDTGGTTEDILSKTGLNVAALPRYIRFNVTLDLNASGTDYASWVATCVLGGKEAMPVA